jgi:hypothetical protein
MGLKEGRPFDATTCRTFKTRRPPLRSSRRPSKVLFDRPVPVHRHYSHVWTWLVRCSCGCVDQQVHEREVTRTGLAVRLVERVRLFNATSRTRPAGRVSVLLEYDCSRSHPLCNRAHGARFRTNHSPAVRRHVRRHLDRVRSRPLSGGTDDTDVCPQSSRTIRLLPIAARRCAVCASPSRFWLSSCRRST